MHYIVFDLEWNQADGRIGHEGGLPFEIVEIGAVKLNRKMQIVDRFEEVIKPKIYPHMHFMTTKIIQLDKKDLENGKEHPVIYGYISLALKILTVPAYVSNRLRRELDGYNAKIHGQQISDFPCYLIGQLSKNSEVRDNPVTGSDLLNIAF